MRDVTPDVGTFSFPPPVPHEDMLPHKEGIEFTIGCFAVFVTFVAAAVVLAGTAFIVTHTGSFWELPLPEDRG